MNGSDPPADLLEVAEALAGLVPLQDEGGRSTFVSMIGQMLGRPLDAAFHPIPRMYMANVTLACANQAGGLTALLRVVDFVADGTYGAARVRSALSHARAHLDPAAERAIRDLLEGLRPPSLIRLYHAAAEGTVSRPPRGLADAWQAFTLLRDHNAGPDGLPPHVLFVALVIQVMSRRASAPPGLAEHEAARLPGLRDWVDARAAELREAGAAAAAERLVEVLARSEPSAEGAQLPLYLIVQIEPVDRRGPDGRPLCRLSHWRQLNPFDWRPEPGEDQTLPMIELPARVGALVREAEREWAHGINDALVLEFVLPVPLLNLGVERWTRDFPGDPDAIPLGMEYEIVLRSLDRLRAPADHRHWERRWSELEAGAVGCATLWVGEEAKGEARGARRLRDILINRWEVVACVLSTAPDRERGAREVRTALRLGVPILLWHPRGVLDPEGRAVLGELTARPHPGLPGEVRKLRAASRAHTDADESDACHFVILCDDPNHFLDATYPLRAPETNPSHGGSASDRDGG